MTALSCVENPDFILVNETWANGDYNKAFFSIPGFEIICRKDRNDTSNGIGGGLIIYAKQEIARNVVEFSNDKLEDFVQCSAFKIPVDGKSVTLVLLYRPHHIYKDTVIQPIDTAENNDKLCDLLNEIPKPYIIVGDLNYSQIDWNLMTSDCSTKKFLDAVQDNFLSQHIDFSTHSSGSQPDIVLTSCPNLVLEVEKMPHLAKSDHSMVLMTIAGKVPSSSTTEEVPDWRKADLQLLREELTRVNFQEKMRNLDALQSWECVKEAIRKVEDKCVPKKKRRISNRPLWMQQNVMRTIRKKRRLWATYQKSKDYDEYLAYKRVEAETRSLVRQAKRKFEKKLAKESKKKPKMFYSYLKSKTSNRTSVGPLKENEQVVSDDIGISNILNKFFASVFTVEDPDVPESTQHNVDNELSNVEFLDGDVLKKIQVLKDTSAAGPDKIGARILKETSDILCGPLALVFSRCLDEGCVPEDWRKANVTPIFKSGSRMSPGNYRPISLTCIICKIMESVIRDKIVFHLVSNNLLNSSQHGFWASKSCQTNLIEYMNTLTKLVDEGHSIDIIYLDFAKAFDKVPHLRLLNKLEGHGISGKVLNWIQNWLTNRQQRVVLNGNVSEWLPVKSGVPQGSVLGPTCFVIFINDLDEVLNLVDGFVYKFADDTKYGRTVRSEEDQMCMQNNINNLLNWADRWQMSFNELKCKIMHIGKNNPQYSYYMGGYAPGGTVLKVVQEEKDLGVMISNSLKPYAQCAKAAKTANSVLGQMSRSFHYRDKDTWIRLYKIFVRPHLELCVQAWCPWYVKDIELLESIQKRALNMVVGLNSTSYEDKLKEICLPSLQERRVRGDMIQTWKYAQGVNPGGEKLIKRAQDVHGRITRQTRSPHNLARVEFRTEVRKNFYASRCVEQWNRLPDSIQGAENVDNFKRDYDLLMSR